MTLACGTSQVRIFRGATAHWSTTFYDQDGLVVQPSGAVITISYKSTTSDALLTASVTMSPPVLPSVKWTADWDSRSAGPGLVSWSIHTVGGPPFSVEDGAFDLVANNANLVTF